MLSCLSILLIEIIVKFSIYNFLICFLFYAILISFPDPDPLVFGLPDPDQLVTDMDPDPSIVKQI